MEGTTAGAGSSVAGGNASGNEGGNSSGNDNTGKPVERAGGHFGSAAGKDAGAESKKNDGATEKKAGESTDGQGKESAPAPKAAEKPAPKKYRIPTDDGGEEELDEGEVKRRVMHAREANRRMEESAVARKSMEAFIDQLTSDPVGVLEQLAAQKRLKVDHVEAMEKRLAEHYKRQLMTPEQVQAEDNARKVHEYESWKAQQAQAAQQAQLAEAQRHFEQEYDQKITSVLNTAGLPKTAGVVKRVAGLMELAIRKGYEPNLDIIVDVVRKDYHGDTKALYESLEPDQLLEVLGETVANKIRKADLARLKQTQKVEPPKSEPKPRQTSERARHNPREFFEQAMRRAGMK